MSCRYVVKERSVLEYFKYYLLFYELGVHFLVDKSIPVRFAAENLNCKVDWINSTKEAVIVYED